MSTNSNNSCNLLSCFTTTATKNKTSYDNDEVLFSLKEIFDTLSQKGNEEKILNAYCDNFNVKDAKKYLESRFDIKKMAITLTKDSNIHSTSNLLELKVFLKILKLSPNGKNTDGFTLLESATYANNSEFVEVLLEMGADANILSENENSLLFSATINNFFAIASLLIKAGCDINCKGKEDGFAPLFIAAQSGSIDFVKLLVDAKCDIDVQTNSGMTSLLGAVMNGHTEVVNLLVKAGCKVNLQDDIGIFPLSMAAHEGFVDIVKILLDNGGDVNLQTFDGVCPLYVAVQNNHLDVVKLLLKAGTRKDLLTKWNDTPLHAAAKNGFFDCLELLVNNGYDLNAKSLLGNSPLHQAATIGNLECVKFLVENGSDVTSLDVLNGTPLICAITNNHTDVAKFLLSCKDSQSTINTNFALTPLLVAILYKNSCIVKLLLELGCDPNSSSNSGYLLIATEKELTDIVKLLLEHGCVSKCNDSLICAIEMNQRDIVKLLIDNGKCDLQLPSDSGATPLILAREKGNMDIIAMLEEALEGENK